MGFSMKFSVFRCLILQRATLGFYEVVRQDC